MKKFTFLALLTIGMSMFCFAEYQPDFDVGNDLHGNRPPKKHKSECHPGYNVGYDLHVGDYLDLDEGFD